EKKALGGDIGNYLEGVMSHERHSFHLHLRSGEVIILKDYISRLTRLGKIIKEATLPHLLPLVLSKLNEGRVLDFGPILICPDGIEIADKSFPVNTIQDRLAPRTSV